MTWKKFEYFLNAVHYCMWRRLIAHQIFIRDISTALFSRISKFLLRKKRRESNDRISEESKKLEDFYRNKKNGFCISWTHHWLGYIYSCYPCFISFILAAIMIRIFNDFNTVVIIVVILPIAIAYIPVKRALYKNDRYLNYFKEFEKEDDSWHKKWSRITTAFCLGAVVMTVAGVAAMWAVWLW